jgi:hypothetical protein
MYSSRNFPSCSSVRDYLKIIHGERQDIARFDFIVGQFLLSMPDTSSLENSEEPYINVIGATVRVRRRLDRKLKEF